MSRRSSCLPSQHVVRIGAGLRREIHSACDACSASVYIISAGAALLPRPSGLDSSDVVLGPRSMNFLHSALLNELLAVFPIVFRRQIRLC